MLPQQPKGIMHKNSLTALLSYLTAIDKRIKKLEAIAMADDAWLTQLATITQMDGPPTTTSKKPRRKKAKRRGKKRCSNLTTAQVKQVKDTFALLRKQNSKTTPYQLSRATRSALGLPHSGNTIYNCLLREGVVKKGAAKK